MLAKNTRLDIDSSDHLMGRFGTYAMELLIEDLISRGADPKRFEAKIFGGSNVFNLPENTGAQVGAVNINFAFNYLNTHNIKIVNSDTGGIKPRKIFFDPSNAKVFLKYVDSSMADSKTLLTKEKKYLAEMADMETKAAKYMHIKDMPEIK